MTRTLRDRRADFRIDAGDLATLGCFLFGRRWQTPLARELAIDVRLVRRWKRRDRRVSVRMSARIVALAAERHLGRRDALDARFAAMADALLSAEARQALIPYRLQIGLDQFPGPASSPAFEAASRPPLLAASDRLRGLRS